MGAHESMEHAEHAEHASGSNKKIALLIAVIALFLAFSETLGKGAQTDSISKNVEASNLWAFFQAKSIRRTVVEATSDQARLSLGVMGDDAAKAALFGQSWMHSTRGRESWAHMKAWSTRSMPSMLRARTRRSRC